MEGRIHKGGTNDEPSTPRPQPASGQGIRRHGTEQRDAARGVAEDDIGFPYKEPKQVEFKRSPLQVLFYVLLRDYIAIPALDHAVAKAKSILRRSGYAQVDPTTEARCQAHASLLSKAMASATGTEEQAAPSPPAEPFPDQETYIKLMWNRSVGIRANEEYTKIMEGAGEPCRSMVLALMERLWLIEHRIGGLGGTER